MCWFADWVTLLSARCKYKIKRICALSWAVTKINKTLGIRIGILHDSTEAFFNLSNLC